MAPRVYGIVVRCLRVHEGVGLRACMPMVNAPHGLMGVWGFGRVCPKVVAPHGLISASREASCGRDARAWRKTVSALFARTGTDPPGACGYDGSCRQPKANLSTAEG